MTKPHWIILFALGLGLVFQTKAADLINTDSEWRYFKGISEASAPDRAAWREPGFNDSGWLVGRAPFYYENSSGYTGNTVLNDMSGQYVSVFLRRTFELTHPEDVETLTLDVRSDDGCIVWLNGREVARLGMPGGEPTYQTSATDANDEPKIATVTVVNEPGLLIEGDNVLAIQAANASLSGSSDFLISASLSAAIDESAPEIEDVLPAPGATVRELTSVVVLFSENVVGVDAGDLLINGVPASAAEMYSPREYGFNFSEPPQGAVEISWAADHGITDTAGQAHSLASSGWIYLLNSTAPPVNVVISELLAVNDNGIWDEDGDRSDWIELRNLDAEAASLDGWFLTDNAGDLTQWRLPAVTIPPGGYLVVWASEKNRAERDAELHTNFRLASEGEYLALVDSRTNVVSAFDPAYPEQRADVSFGRDVLDVEQIGYFPTPTPGEANGSGGSGFAPDPLFSVAGGIYVTNQMTIEITAPSGTIWYSTDGVAPIPNRTGKVYSGPLSISGNTFFQARVYVDGLLPGRTVAEGYYLAAGNLANFTSNLPLLILQPSTQSITQNSEARTPVFVTAIEPFRGRASLFGPASHRGMGGLNIRGQTSRGFPKQPYRLELKDPAGIDLNVPLLGLPADDDWVLNGPYSDKSFLNNFLAFELHEKMGHYAVRRRFVEVFLDLTGGGLSYPADYRGIYVLLEKIKVNNDRVDVARMTPSDNQEPEITGGYVFKKDKDSPGDIDFSTQGGAGFSSQRLKYHEPPPGEITTAQRNWLRNYLINFEQALYAPDWLSRTGDRHYSHFIDVDSFVDSHWIVEFSKQIDGYRLSNYMRKDRGGKVKMSPIWDWNLSFGNADYLNGWISSGWYYDQINENQHIWLRRLISGSTNPAGAGDPNFNQAIIDRWSVLRTNILASASVTARIDEIAGYLNEAQARDFSRWPRLNSYVWPNPSIYIQSTYGGIISNKKQWVRSRFDWIDSQFLPTPSLSLAGGYVARDRFVSISAPAGGTVHYTLDGRDPRASGGGVRPGALAYTSPIHINQNRVVFARYREGARWSGPAIATYVTEIPPLRISELMYDPAPGGGIGEDPGDFEYIELVNLGAVDLDLAGFRLVDGVEFDFTTGTVRTLSPGGRVLVVGNRAAFESRYGVLAEVTGEYTGRLDNSGETIELIGPMGELVQRFSYDGDWYPSTRGQGFSLTPSNPQAPPHQWKQIAGWRTSGARGGTPGQMEFSADAVPMIVINEILSNPSGGGGSDMVELFNPGQEAVDAGGWFLSDRLDELKFQLPPDSVVPAGGYLVVDGFNPTFGLSSSGEEVYLFAATAQGELTGYAHAAGFGATPRGMTAGRHVTEDGKEHFVIEAAPTLGEANAGPRVGPVVISEIMYHPPDVFANGAYWNVTEDEYVEVVNVSDEPVVLFDPSAPDQRWELSGGVDYEFSGELTLGPGERISIVSFDPVLNSQQGAAFRAKYDVPGEVRIVGPWDGALDNASDSVQLRRRISLTAGGGVSSWEWVLMDRVEYRDAYPWPNGADGSGLVLQRAREHTYGDDPENWLATAPSAGAGPVLDGLPRITKQPAGVGALAGRVKSLEVTAEGAGTLQYQWRKEGAPLPNQTGAVLDLGNLQASHAGEYDVVVSNEVGAVVSAPVSVRVAAAGADSDGDGLMDLYEATHGLDLRFPDDAEFDADGDGVTTWDEYLAGTNPWDPASRFQFHEAKAGEGNVELAFQGAANRQYRVEYRDSAAGGAWQLLETIDATDTGSAELRELIVVDSGAAGERFYRIIAEMP